MLSPRLTNCPECANIPSLLKKIDCKLAELGNSLYNNISYMLNQPIPAGDILQLIAYRRILMHKYCNPNYVHEYSVAMIASRVIRLTVGCVSRCNEQERCLEEPCDIKIVPNPTTTSTSTLPVTTTTSTSSTTSTTTTVVPTTTTTSSSSTSTTTSSSSSTTTTTTTICQDCIAYGFPNPNDGNGTGTINGITVTTTYTGPSINAPGPRNNYNNCAGFPMDADTLYIAQLTGAFTLTISFSSPVNDVYISNSAMGYNLFPGQQECFTVNSDQGTPTLSLVGGCYDYGPVGNQICGSHQGGNTGGATRVSTTTPYTQLTITGTGISNLVGYGFDICFPSCNTTTTTSSTSSTSTTTSSTSSTTSTTTTLSGLNTIYTHFESLTPTTTSTTSTTAVPTTTTTSSTSTSTTTVTTTEYCSNCINNDVTIGTQVWTGCNLNVTTFRNGDPILQVTDPTAWAALTTPAWCYYNNDSANDVIYGKLYNWYAVNDPRGLAPVGYHIPTNSEHLTLVNYLGGSTVAGGPLKQIGICRWNDPNIGATDDYGFTALPGGARGDDGTFAGINIIAPFWSSTSEGPDSSKSLILYRTSTNALTGFSYNKEGFSIRCIKD